jgi:hypothetical protein
VAKTIAQGQAKWERKTGNAGDKWKQAVSGAGGAYARGLAEAGAPPGPQTVSAWEQGTSAVRAGDFQQAISGKGSKWAENFRRGVAR